MVSSSMDQFVVSVTGEHSMGLGIVSHERVLTCAHLCHNLAPDQASSNVFRIETCDGKVFSLITQTVDFSFDFMSLAEKSLSGTCPVGCETTQDIFSNPDSPIPNLITFGDGVTSV